MPSAASSAEPVIALVAGEASGDQLGAALIKSLRDRCPGARFVGIGGPKMQAAGLTAWWDSSELSVMGLFEVLSHLPRLLALRKQLCGRLLETRPDILIGIDAPDFNLGLERQVRSAGITTAHYVSPTVWAWRPKRARKIAASTEMVICLFPFEPECYRGHGVEARFTGHPMADAIDLETDRAGARSMLGLVADGLKIALLPGSRAGEMGRMASPMLDAAEVLTERYPGVEFLAPMSGSLTLELFTAQLKERKGLKCAVFNGSALEAITAADVVICASGTAALETMLVNRPMVVVYRLSAISYLVGRTLKLLKSKHISMPNILAGERLVPELVQHQANGAAIANEVAKWIEDEERTRSLKARFGELHRLLRRNAAETTASVICELLNKAH